PPPMMPAVSWTGFYLGADVGARLTDSDVTNCAPVFLSGTPCPTRFFGATSTRNPRSTDSLGGQIGVHGGYNQQINPAWLVGVEADFNVGRANATIRGLPGLNTVGSAGANGSDRVDVNQDWSSSIRA